MGRDHRRLILCAVLFAAPALAEVTVQEAIGWKLFFDPILSRPQNFSCSTCHVPSKGFEGGEPLSKGAHGDVLGRNTPTVVNLADAEFFFWDGRASSLEEQAVGPIQHPQEMDLTLPEAVKRVGSQPHYRRAFKKAGVRKITSDAMVEAIAAFERRLVTGEAIIDRWLAGDRNALNEQQERGRMIFFTRGDCALCHNGKNFTDDYFHNIGTGHPDDLGRYAIEKDERMKGAFKTPGLRNWKGREPFMHDGRFDSIERVVAFYDTAPGTSIGESEVDKIDLTKQEQEDLIAFLETLNGAWPDLEPFEAAWEALGVE